MATVVKDAAGDRHPARRRPVNAVDVTASGRRHRATARERSRTRSINDAFDRLRDLLPPPPRTADPGASRRRHGHGGPSKLDTLRLAVDYIGCLTRLINEDAHSMPLSPPDSPDSRAVVVIGARLQPTGHYRGQS